MVGSIIDLAAAESTYSNRGSARARRKIADEGDGEDPLGGG